MKADPFAQRRLLDLQAIDTDLDRARYRAAHLPEAVAAAEAARLLAKVQDQQVAISTELSDVKRELTRAEHDVATVRARADRDRSQLASGEITSSKAPDRPGHEVESLARRQRDLEDAELAVMEQVEGWRRPSRPVSRKQLRRSRRWSRRSRQAAAAARPRARRGGSAAATPVRRSTSCRLSWWRCTTGCAPTACRWRPGWCVTGAASRARWSSPAPISRRCDRRSR